MMLKFNITALNREKQTHLEAVKTKKNLIYSALRDKVKDHLLSKRL